MTHEPQKFVVVDPRSMDGNPYDVAQRAVAQLAALQRLAELSLGPTELMARNADLERQIALGNEPDATGWAQTPQGRMFLRIGALIAENIQALKALERAVAYDPRHPPKA